MSKLVLIVAIFVATVLTSRPVFPSTNQLNAAPNDDVIAGIKALHRSPEKEMARLKSLLDENKSAAKRHEWLYLYALGKEKRGEYNEALTLAEICINDVYASSLIQQRAKLLKAKILESLNAKLETLESSSNEFCIAMIDIDFFKSINDNYGHKMGDDALRLFSYIARQIFPDHVDMGRLGGEEFLFIFHKSTERQCVELLDDFRKLLKTAACDQLSEEISLTFSAGLKEINSPHTTTACLEDADKALYEAKESGRDQTVIFKCL